MELCYSSHIVLTIYTSNGNSQISFMLTNVADGRSSSMNYHSIRCVSYIQDLLCIFRLSVSVSDKSPIKTISLIAVFGVIVVVILVVAVVFYLRYKKRSARGKSKATFCFPVF